jgi:hypothetical protein
MGVKQVLVRPRYGDDDDGSSCSTGSSSSAGRCDDEALDQSPSPPPMSSCGRYLLHRVCRFDTLAGVAIKYGVEVGNNGLSPSSSPLSSIDPSLGRHLTRLLRRRPPRALVACLPACACCSSIQVADVKRANGLTTDLQMFAHKTLRVPLHGRHAPATAPSPPSSSPSHADRAARFIACLISSFNLLFTGLHLHANQSHLSSPV